MRIDDEMGWIRPGRARGRASRLALRENSDRYDVFDAVEAVLIIDPSVEAVEIWVGRNVVGHTTRTVVGNILDDSGLGSATRGLGDGDGASLPGNPKLRPVRVRCPHCHTDYWVTSVDDRDPPRCPQCDAAMSVVS